MGEAHGDPFQKSLAPADVLSRNRAGEASCRMIIKFPQPALTGLSAVKFPAALHARDVERAPAARRAKENCPAFQRWVSGRRGNESRQGRKKRFEARRSSIRAELEAVANSSFAPFAPTFYLT